MQNMIQWINDPTYKYWSYTKDLRRVAPRATKLKYIKILVNQDRSYGQLCVNANKKRYLKNNAKSSQIVFTGRTTIASV